MLVALPLFEFMKIVNKENGEKPSSTSEIAVAILRLFTYTYPSTKNNKLE